VLGNFDQEKSENNLVKASLPKTDHAIKIKIKRCFGLWFVEKVFEIFEKYKTDDWITIRGGSPFTNDDLTPFNPF